MASVQMPARYAMAVAMASSSIVVLPAKAQGRPGSRGGIFVGVLKDYCEGRLQVGATATSLALQIALTPLCYLRQNGFASCPCNVPNQGPVIADI